MEEELCEFYGPPPTFMRSILQDDDSITLIYRKPKKLLEPDDTSCVDNTLDLTGNPLVVDLKCDTNLSILPKSNNWTETELGYLPLHLNSARKVINELNNGNSNGNNSAKYCICDASDKRQTVILGSYVTKKHKVRRFIRTAVSIIGWLAEDNTKLSLEYMKNEHYQAVGERNSKFSSIVKNKYVLYGSDLKNQSHTVDTECNSSIHVDVSWNNFQYNLPSYVKSVELTLQCIVGHKDSKLYNLWKELHSLNSHIIILSRELENIEKTSISKDPEPYTQIIVKLCEVLSVNTIQKPIPKFNMPQTDLNMQDLREYDLLDKLWTILTRCHRVEDLKVCLHTFFEELTHTRINITIPAQNHSLISKIIEKILAGEIAIPTLTPKQAVECLIELGIEKLKNDYLYIYNHFDFITSEKLHSYWDKISEINDDKSFDFRMHLRLSHLPLFDLYEIQKKFSFLAYMHTTLEFVLVAKDFTAFIPETFSYIADCILKQYLDLDDFVQLQYTLPTCQFHELKINLNSTNTSFLQGLKAISRNFKMLTDNRSRSVTTIFHHSRDPIFPPTIYDSYANTDEDEVFFVVKSVTYSNEV